MRKSIIIIAVAFTAVITIRSLAQQKMPQILLPKEMAPEVASQNLEAAAKGYALYQLICSKCHGGKNKGKDAIPDFTITQLEAYKIRIANYTHIERLDDRSLTSEELNLITTFFMYKKPVGRPFNPEHSLTSDRH